MKRFNEFIGLRDGEETAPATDFMIIYGVLGFITVVGIVFTYQLITF